MSRLLIFFFSGSQLEMGEAKGLAAQITSELLFEQRAVGRAAVCRASKDVLMKTLVSGG